MELDDPDEPIMPGSGDEFSDLEVEESDSEDGPPGSLQGTPSHSSPPKTAGPSHFMTANLIATAVTLEEAEESNLPGASQGTPSHSSPPNATANLTSTATTLVPSGTNTTAQPTSWSSTLKSVMVKPFTSPVGPTVPISASPLEVFELFSSDLMEMIVEQSNEYAEQVMGDEKFDQWNKMTVVELKAFLGFLILMAISHLPALDDYWKRDPLMHYTPVAHRM